MGLLPRIMYNFFLILGKVLKYLSSQGFWFSSVISIYLIWAFKGGLFELLNNHSPLDRAQAEASFYAPLIALSGISLALSLKDLFIDLNSIESRSVSKYTVFTLVVMTTILSISVFKILPLFGLLPMERHDAVSLLIGMGCLIAVWVVQRKQYTLLEMDNGAKVAYFASKRKTIDHQTLRRVVNSISGGYIAIALCLLIARLSI